MKVLVAEDEAVVREILETSVRDMGHECVAAPDGEAAWRAYLEDSEIEAIVSDWIMPNLDGGGLRERVRELEAAEGRSVLFVFLTSMSREKVSRSMGPHDRYLQKPLAPSLLREILADA